MNAAKKYFIVTAVNASNITWTYMIIQHSSTDGNHHGKISDEDSL
jgi:hypothetical protein